jgi:hypothetical protein
VLSATLAGGIKADVAPLISSAPPAIRAELKPLTRPGADASRELGRIVADAPNRPSNPARDGVILALRSSFASSVARVYQVSLFVAVLALLASIAMPGKRLEPRKPRS